ncbi:MFS transporter [Pseudonocardia sp. ICBG1142]|uniref:MFS transporter n=1 Tax=Pseudonocardia sp. ICBG1142 TaxID=2846760 RepID=UPI001CF6A2C9|nr:MFS transporter [Pseudonocardia sp. ICBG1142]
MTAGRRARALVALVQVLGLAVWFSASAVLPELRAEWNLSATAGVWLTTSVQLGFAAGAVVSAVLTRADRVPPQRLLAGGAAAAAACTLLLAAVVDGPVAALVLRTLTGVCLALVYPVGMKIMTSWSDRSRRARDLGVLVGALTVGSALPHLIGGLPGLPWRGVLAGAALCGLAAAALAHWCLRPGPALAPAPPPDTGYALRLLREPGPRLVVLGYLGHMWELYALWTWLGAALAGGDPGPSEHLLVFVAAGLGGAAGCVLGGRAADRYGRVPVIATALLVSGVCSVVSPFVIGAAPLLVSAFCVLWGAAAVADSAVLTTATIEIADPRYTGTALTVQTALGFLLTVAGIATVPVVAAAVGWQAALVVLAVGPALGLPAVLALRRHLPAVPAPSVTPSAGPAAGLPMDLPTVELPRIATDDHPTAPLPRVVAGPPTVELYRLRRAAGVEPDPSGVAGRVARVLSDRSRGAAPPAAVQPAAVQPNAAQPVAPRLDGVPPDTAPPAARGSGWGTGPAPRWPDRPDG